MPKSDTMLGHFALIKKCKTILKPFVLNAMNLVLFCVFNQIRVYLIPIDYFLVHTFELINPGTIFSRRSKEKKGERIYFQKRVLNGSIKIKKLF